MNRACVNAVLATALLSLCFAAPALRDRRLVKFAGSSSSQARQVRADAAPTPSGATNSSQVSDADRAGEEFQRQDFIDLSKFRDDDDVVDEANADDETEQGDALDRESVSTFKDTISNLKSSIEDVEKLVGKEGFVAKQQEEAEAKEAALLDEEERVREDKEEIDERNRTLMAEAERLKENKERVLTREEAVEEREASANQEEKQILTKKEHLAAKQEKLSEEEKEVMSSASELETEAEEVQEMEHSLKNKATKAENSINDLLLEDVQGIKEKTKEIQEVDSHSLAKEEAVLNEKMKAVDDDISGTLAKTGEALEKEAAATVEEQRKAEAAAVAAMKSADVVLSDENAASPQAESDVKETAATAADNVYEGGGVDDVADEGEEIYTEYDEEYDADEEDADDAADDAAADDDDDDGGDSAQYAKK